MALKAVAVRFHSGQIQRADQLLAVGKVLVEKGRHDTSGVVKW